MRDGERSLYKISTNEAGGKRYAYAPSLSTGGHPTPEGIDRLKHEFGLKDYLESEWAVRPLELIRDRGRILLLVDYRGEERLDGMGRPLEVGRFLRMAVELAVAIGRLRSKRGSDLGEERQTTPCPRRYRQPS